MDERKPGMKYDMNGARGAKLRDPELFNLPSLIRIGLSEVLGKVRQPGLKGILFHALGWLASLSFPKPHRAG